MFKQSSVPLQVVLISLENLVVLEGVIKLCASNQMICNLSSGQFLWHGEWQLHHMIKCNIKYKVIYFVTLLLTLFDIVKSPNHQLERQSYFRVIKEESIRRYSKDFSNLWGGIRKAICPSHKLWKSRSYYVCFYYMNQQRATLNDE